MVANGTEHAVLLHAQTCNNEQDMARFLQKLQGCHLPHPLNRRLFNIIVEQFANLMEYAMPSTVGGEAYNRSIEVGRYGSGKFYVKTDGYGRDEDLEKLRNRIGSINSAIRHNMNLSEIFMSRLSKDKRNRGLGLLKMFKEAGGAVNAVKVRYINVWRGPYQAFEVVTILDP